MKRKMGIDGEVKREIKGRKVDHCAYSTYEISNLKVTISCRSPLRAWNRIGRADPRR